jgi:CO dehydrogenase maturation factor
VQHLLIISDPSQRGIVAAERIASFRHELDINIDHAYLLINRLSGELPSELQAKISSLDIPLLGVIPADYELTEYEFSGKPLISLDDSSPVYQAVEQILSKIM